MEQAYLIDTNAIIDYVANKLPESGYQLIEDEIPKVSVITRMELLSWSNADELQIQILEEFLNASIIYTLEEPTIIKTIEIRKQFKVKLPDAIIAATALTYNLTLITRNTNDFKNIDNLKTINPYE